MKVSDGVQGKRRFRRALVVGGAGFIGSHFVDALLGDPESELVTVFDNFSSGRAWHLEHHSRDNRLRIVRGEASDRALLTGAARGCDVIIHLASNPDIAAAMTDPSVDFHQGTALTHAVVEAAREAEVGTILYASGSGVYGDLGYSEAEEDHGPLLPTSTYGASKIAGEALICSYAHMFDFHGYVFRFGNVVGARQTHGVGFDFVRRLLEDPSHLRILGDGKQSKSYIHVSDVVRAVLLAGVTVPERYQAFNVATGDYINVNEIARLAMEAVGLEPGMVVVEHTGGAQGWKGDVPVVRLKTDRIRSLGWQNSWSSREALRMALESIATDARAGRFDPEPSWLARSSG